MQMNNDFIKIPSSDYLLKTHSSDFLKAPSSDYFKTNEYFKNPSNDFLFIQNTYNHNNEILKPQQYSCHDFFKTQSNDYLKAQNNEFLKT